MNKKPLALITALLAGGMTVTLPALAQTVSPATPEEQTQTLPKAPTDTTTAPIDEAETEADVEAEAGPEAQTGAPTMTTTTTQTQTTTQTSGSSVRVGRQVVNQLDDLRESIAGLVAAVRDAGQGMGLANWQQNTTQLQQMEQQLQQMEQTLEQKADNTDSAWTTWMTGQDYRVTVTDQVNSLGNVLSDLATMLGGTRGQSNLQIVVGDRLIDQVDDVREEVADLVDALSDGGPEFGWRSNEPRFSQVEQRLDKLGRALDERSDMSDEEWRLYQASQEYGTFVQQNLSELAEIVKGLFQAGSGVNTQGPGQSLQRGQGNPNR